MPTEYVDYETCVWLKENGYPRKITQGTWYYDDAENLLLMPYEPEEDEHAEEWGIVCPTDVDEMVAWLHENGLSDIIIGVFFDGQHPDKYFIKASPKDSTGEYKVTGNDSIILTLIDLAKKAGVIE